MKRSVFVIVRIVILSFILAIWGCDEGNKKAPAATSAPLRSTATPLTATPAPADLNLSEDGARAIVEKNFPDEYARWAVESDPAKFGYVRIELFKVSSMECTKTTDSRYYFTLYGSFYGVDKYGSSLGRFTFDYEVSVSKKTGKFYDSGWSATVRKQ